MIKMLTAVGGKDKDGKDFNVMPNQETDVFSKEEEARYVESGQALAVKTKTTKK